MLKYFASGCPKYRPLTDAAGIMANDSVNAMPISVACNSLKSVVFSLCSGQAG